MIHNKKPISEWKQYINPSGKCLYWNQKSIFLCNTYIKNFFGLPTPLCCIWSNPQEWYDFFIWNLLYWRLVLFFKLRQLFYHIGIETKEETNIKHISYLVYVWLSWMAHWPLLLSQSHIQKLPHWKSTYFGFMCICLSD